MILRVAMALSVACGLALAENAAEKRLSEASIVLGEAMGMKEQSIPQDLLNKAHCVAVVPGVKKAAFIVGGKFGRGFFLCRRESGEGWSAPGAIRIEGGSVGFQIGGSETDVIMLVMNASGRNKLLASKFTLGGDASAAAGPVGRTAAAQTDVQMRAEILTYSRARGVFAGISLDGATLRPDEKAIEQLYGKKLANKDIVSTGVAAPAAAQDLIDLLTKHSSRESK
ncbi:MAG: lipid-binding SYLF domain-containing protein [bacterium]|nr:lipid-binding SYLF domain-containing protein [bacterium]